MLLFNLLPEESGGHCHIAAELLVSWVIFLIDEKSHDLLPNPREDHLEVMLLIELSKEVEEPGSFSKFFMIVISEFEHHFFNFLHLLESERDGEILLFISKKPPKIIGMEHEYECFINFLFVLVGGEFVAFHSILDFSINKIVVDFNLTSIFVLFIFFQIDIEPQFLFK